MKFFAFGLGYCAQYFLQRHGERFESAAGTVRDLATPRLGNVDLHRFAQDGADPLIPELLAAADVILVSIAPGTSVDPTLARFGRQIAAVKRPQRILYLSTIGVYGDRGGEWVDENDAPTPLSERSKVRAQAEKAWLALGRDPLKRVHVLRLSGIYGPGRNALLNLAEGRAHRYIKAGQVFNRIHVEDIAQAVSALIGFDGASDVWNITDDEPAPPQDVVVHAAELMGVEPPMAQDFETADLSPMARSFYAENKRCSNRKMRDELGLDLAFPTYREGLEALWTEMNGQSSMAAIAAPQIG